MIEIVSSTNSDYQFHIKSKSGSTLLTSKKFENKIELENTLSNLKNLQINRGNFERKTNHQGKFLFNFKDENGSLLGSSQLYDSEAGMENGIKNLHNRLTELKEL
ncbi:DUF1508 domain-containing protein [Zobellia amurskyensis]|uniref:DUF1508 domain-containing protein n=1 Tax=Zobellia amurskyensis TaxID=248905 RepID=UPI0012D88DBB